MHGLQEWLLTAVPAYLAGSIPFGLLVVRWRTGQDLRKVGSGNIGATNASRVVGSRWGSAILLFDALKGLLPALVLPLLVTSEADSRQHLAVLAGLAAICGHMFPVWLRFQGGKGVATALGVVCVLGWKSLLPALIVFAVAFALTRFVALGSILAAVSFAVSQLLFLAPNPFSHANWSLAAFSLLVPALIIIRHRSNIVRLLRGEEARYASSDLSPEASLGSGQGPDASDQEKQ